MGFNSGFKGLSGLNVTAVGFELRILGVKILVTVTFRAYIYLIHCKKKQTKRIELQKLASCLIYSRQKLCLKKTRSLKAAINSYRMIN